MVDAFALEAQAVSKQFEGAKAPALQDISLAVATGEFYSFLGPSGCGKTTMLRIFAGFETATSGQILIDGKPMNGVPPNKRPVNMVFQSYALFPHLSVLENVAFGLRAKGKVAPADIINQSKEALSIVRLASFADRLPAQLSGGQQQRVALARALVMRPVVLLLDEPLSALDVQIREEMQEELSRLQRELNISFVMVTHDQSEALALSSRVAVFNQGRIEQIGTPREIYDSPRTSFVAKFIGRSNVLTGRVLEAGGRTVLIALTDGQKVVCALEEGRPAPAEGEEVSLCIKPEAVLPVVRSADFAASENVNAIPCKLESSLYQGSLADLRLSILGSAMVLRATVPAQALTTIAGQDDLMMQFASSDLRLLLDSGPSEEKLAASESAHAAVS